MGDTVASVDRRHAGLQTTLADNRSVISGGRCFWRSVAAVGLPRMAPLCVRGWSSPPREYAPVLAVVKQSALDVGCGPALIEGVGNGSKNAAVRLRRRA